MQELVRITQNSITGAQTVSARELHEFMESNRQYTNWINDRISKYSLIENQDYILLNNFVKQNGSGGHNRIEYALTLDCAKQLAMVENNEKGRQIRMYFIEAEKKYRENSILNGNQAIQIMHGMLDLYKSLNESLQQVIANNVSLHKELTNSRNTNQDHATLPLRRSPRQEREFIERLFEVCKKGDRDSEFKTASEITEIVNAASGTNFNIVNIGRALAKGGFAAGNEKIKGSSVHGWYVKFK